MDPTLSVKAIFGDLVMQIAVLQTQLQEAQHQIAELQLANRPDIAPDPITDDGQKF